VFAAPRDLIVRSSPFAGDRIKEVIEAVRVADQHTPITDVRSLDAILDAAVAERRAYRDLFAMFATLALVVAAIGVYGVMSYSVATRTEEIGVRVALGASRRDIVRLILGQAVTSAVGGIALGSIGSVLTNRLLGKLLYGVGSTDAAALIAVTSIMLTVVTLSAYLPAIRAAKVHPLEALRAEWSQTSFAPIACGRPSAAVWIAVPWSWRPCRDLSVPDAHDLANSLTHGHGLTNPPIPPIAAVPATVSFDVQWAGEISRATIVNDAQNFRGDFIETGSTIKWSSFQNGFSFESEDPNPARNIGAAIGRERNGVFFARQGD
jgi:hypothetical protein